MQKYWNTVQDEQGRPRYGASVAVKQNGVNSTIYSTSTGTVKTNPLTTDSTRGYFEFFAAAGDYDLVVSGVGFDSYTISSGAEVGLPSADVTFTQSGIGAVSRTVQAKEREGMLLSVVDFGAVIDGVTDNTTAVQACHDAAYLAGRGMFYPTGICYQANRIICKGVPIFGEGIGRSIIKGGAGKDVFYAPDPTTSETGSLATFPENLVVQDVTIRIDNSVALSLPTDFNRPIFPTVGTWAGTTAYSQWQWMKTAGGAIYIATQGGTSGSVEPSHTFGRAYDGTVIWEYVWSAQIYVGNAAFAFPCSNGAIAFNNVTHPKFSNVRIEVTGTTYANSPAAIYCQRGLYDARIEHSIFRFTKFGVVTSPPNTNFASCEFSPDGCSFDNVEFFNTFPLIEFNGSHWIGDGLQVYGSTIGDVGPFLLRYKSLAKSTTHNILFDDLYVETNASTTGPHGIYQGADHTFSSGALKQATGAGYIYWSADHCTISDNVLLNDGVNPALRITGSKNRFTIHTSILDANLSFIDDQGSGNDVRIGNLDSTPLEGRRVGINKPRPDAWMRTGAFGAVGMARTPFTNLEDLFITPSDIKWETTPQPKITKDTTLESGEYVTLPGSGNGYFSTASRQTLKVGTQVPKTKVRVWLKVRAASGTPTQTVELDAPGTLRGSVVMSLTSSFQVFQFDADVDLAAVGDAVQPNFGATSTAVTIDIAWIILQPIPVDLVNRVSADVGDAAKALTVGSSEMVQVWNTPLTANRAVTLSTTGAYNGARFRIRRKAAATGASTVDVGTGPLKSLAVSQWCDVVYNGATSAWELDAFGSL